MNALHRGSLRAVACCAALAAAACGFDTGGTPAAAGDGGPADGGAGLPPGPGHDAGGPSSDAGPAGDASTGDDASPASEGGPAPGDASPGGDGGPPPDATRVVAYLPNYNGSYADWAKRIDFNKMTHLNLAFATATGSNGWDMGASDSDVAALVGAAHAAGTKVIASLGGGGGDQSVIARYKDPNNIDDLVTKLDAFVSAHGFDGVDVDIEDGSNLGASYSAFIDATVAKLRPEGKLVTAAVAQYLQDSMSDATMNAFDFLNVMVYSTYSDAVSELGWYSGTKHVAKDKLTLGAAFFGTDSASNEYAYADILKADGSAWSKDQAQVNGQTVNYTGMASMKKLAEYSKGFGGIMFWELTEDSSDPQYSLYKVIQDAM
jgi:GH18 family chitinase